MVVPFACHLFATLLASGAVWFVILSNKGKAMGKSNGLHEATVSNQGGWLAVHKRVSKLVISIYSMCFCILSLDAKLLSCMDLHCRLPG